MRRTSDVPLADLPDFLQDSPFLPTFNPADEQFEAQHVKTRRPTVLETLNSKPARGVLAAVVAVAAFLYLRSTFRQHQVWTRLTGPSCALQDSIVVPPLPSDPDVDWSHFAYMQYATNTEYLCNSIMIFETLHRLGSKADRLLLYPSKYSIEHSASSIEARLLVKARDEYGVKLQSIEVLHVPEAYWSGPNWADSYTKLLAFNQTQYTRLVVLDSDSSVLLSMDSLFFILPTLAAMPLAWWLPNPYLSSHIMVIQPSLTEFKRVQAAVAKAGVGTYDMEIMNKLFGRKCMVLPMEPYALLTGELRESGHGKWLKRKGDAIWDPERVRREASFVHFSDDPLPKPWLAKGKGLQKYKPACVELDDGQDCRARDIWMELYRDFKERRQRVCGL